MKVLVLSPIYPRIDAKKNTTATKVIHYFAAEWTKQGHDVQVIHTPNRILSVFYVMPQKIKDILKAKTGNEFPDISITKKASYEFEGVSVYRRPVFKLIPRHMPMDQEIRKAVEDIHRYLRTKDFVPDVIVSHWSAPCFQLIAALKKQYQCRTSIVLHDDYYTEHCNEIVKKCLPSIDAIGCRSKTLAERVQTQLGLSKLPFICYSGVPNDYVSTSAFYLEKFEKPITRFIYVGELIERKYCDVVISALAKSDISNWHLDVIGIGNDRERFENLAQTLNVSDQVTFHGRVSRDKVFEFIHDTQCFIMPSKNEAFGLVYLEGMVGSCLTIGSFGEGIDGIIKDGVNGYLVNAGDENSVVDKLNMISKTRLENIRQVALAGYETAVQFTDSNVARWYLDDAMKW